MAEFDMYELQDPETTCGTCYAEFLDPEDLKIHVSQVHSEENKQKLLVKCHFCSHHCNDLELYAIHIRDKHIFDLKCCKYCHRVFNDSSYHKRHEVKHKRQVNKSKYACSNCNDLFTTVFELADHERQAHKYSEEGFFLNNVFPLLSSVLNIKVTRFLQSLCEESDLYSCVSCEHMSNKAEDHIEHLKTNGCRSLACDGCLSVYKNRKSLLRHYYGHPECYHGSDVFKQCKKCFEQYDIRIFKEHVRVCKPMKCKKCNIVFASMDDLSKHQTEEHPAVVHLMSCKYCHKDFVSVAALEKHIQRAHTSNAHLYKYFCVYCNVVFKHPKKLFGHFFSTHKNLEPYTCKICNKKFKIRKSFTLHIKLDHKSIGFVEFDENYHVFFSEKKSEQPFNPSSSIHSYSDDGVIKISDVSTIGEHIQQKGQENSAVTKTINENQFESKVRFDVEENTHNINFVHVNSDFMSVTETEGNNTEVEVDKRLALKRKNKTRIGKNKRKRIQTKTIEEVIISDSSDDDKPLLAVKKRAVKKNQNKSSTIARKMNKDKLKLLTSKGTKNRFVCNICNKRCYTYQNYNNHIATHKKNVTAKCVKCAKVFKSRKGLNDHYTKEHATSQLTETLKSILEKRKSTNEPKMVSNTDKFKLTIKKVTMPVNYEKATIKCVGEKPLSVQKFIESFTPETVTTTKKSIKIEANISIKKVWAQPSKKTLIKMTKCNLENVTPLTVGKKLSFPVTFKPTNEQHKVTVKTVLTSVTNNEEDTKDDYGQQDSYLEEEVEDYNDYNEQIIPDVAQEVMLEGSEEPAPKTIYIPHKVVIPKLPSQCKKIHIAHLLPEAPYYKIVKVEEALNPKKNREVCKPKKDIKLPDGTTLVNVNPLAHLLGDTPVEKILEQNKNKHYTPKPKDFETAVAKAMLKLKNTHDSSPKRRKVNNKTGTQNNSKSIDA